jgi:hypothetical protein
LTGIGSAEIGGGDLALVATDRTDQGTVQGVITWGQFPFVLLRTDREQWHEAL